MIVELHQVCVGITRIRIDRTFDIALRLGPEIAGVERPLVVPGAIELEFDRLVGPPGLLVARNGAAARCRITVNRRVDVHPRLR